MRLYGLAYACRLYEVSTAYDAAAKAFRRATRPIFEMENPAHRKALLVWLNSWRCRQFAKGDHPVASRTLKEWGRCFLDSLPSTRASLFGLADEGLEAAAKAYENLCRRPASTRPQGSKSYTVTIGPTGAAKVLFAVRPGVFPPWDAPIRGQFGYDGSARSYRPFLTRVGDEIRELTEDAERLGITPDEIRR